ncbi:addiction module toxin RelE [Enterococcus faecium]|nr:addiction module toxin RelE [Enterococcus faecium]
MGTKKKRIKIAVTEDQKKSKKRIYPCDSFERIIDNEYVVCKAFREN